MRRGFTLAEVLLTLAIIGVVAALTIPAVITKVTKDQYVVGLKKAYNTLKAIERESIQEHGDMENWDWTGDVATTFETYFKSYFEIIKDCGITTDNGCFNTKRTYLDGSAWTMDFNTDSYYRIITSDGTAFMYTKQANPLPGRQGRFYVDVNGLKGPNRVGRDMFSFNVFPSKLGIKPRGAYVNITGEAIASSDVEASCKAGGEGTYCAAKVLSEGAMNY